MKLHPLSIAYRSVESALGLSWIVFIVFFVAVGALDGLAAFVSIGGLVTVGLIAVVVWQVLYYRRFEYELTDDSFDIRSGVVSRREREIPLRRIQNVSISRNVFQRLFGIAVVQLETAGGDSAEADLRYVSHEEARRLQNELRDRKRSTSRRVSAESADAEEPTDREDPELLFEISGTELAVLGVVSFDARLIPLFIFLIPAFGGNISAWIAGASSLVLLAPILAIGLYLVSAAVSGAISVANYYAFRLYRDAEELRYERGLLQRFSGSIPLEKVQTIIFSENVLARRLEYAALSVETAGFSPGDQGGSTAAVPIAKRDRVERLAQEIEPYGEIEFERPPKRARRRYAFRYLWLLGVVLAVAYAVVTFTGFDGPWYALAALGVLIPPAAHLKWAHLGYALTDDYVVTRAGFWSRATHVVPYHRVQTVLDSQTIFQRRWRLATLTIDTAGSSGLTGRDSKAHDIDAAVADELREEVQTRLQLSLGDRAEERKRERRRTLSDAFDPTPME